jgi:acyl carrier protein
MDNTTFIALVEEILEVAAGTVGMGDFLEEIEWDSLASITFIAEIDSEVGVRIDPQKLAEGVLVSDLFALVTDGLADH